MREEEALTKLGAVLTNINARLYRVACALRELHDSVEL